MRKILLIEPNYSNKYPPIGLMKIATYHRLLGDDVRYFKGDLQNLIVDILFDQCVERLEFIDNSINWRKHSKKLKLFIKTKNSNVIAEEEFQDITFAPLILNVINETADVYRKKSYKQSPMFDRIYVTTLFTFYWKITVQTIEFCKGLVKDPNQLLVGGILASLLKKELTNEVGIEPMSGLLDQPGILDPSHPIGSKLIVDNLPLDYSILDEIEYEYPTKSAYFTFMTKGCTRKCAFCSVPILEPTYKPKIDTLDKFSDIKIRFGEKQNLLLMDNNVLASPKFPEIIDEIKQMGFYKGATYVEPNQLEIAVENLRQSFNDRGFVKRAFKLMHELLPKLKGEVAQRYYNHLANHKLLDIDDVTKENIVSVYPYIAETYEKRRNKAPKLRFVDFNQGTDCRYVTDDLMKKMSEIPIRPLRIAFDYIGLKEQYAAAVRLAAKYDIKELSNYILYNFQDKPEDLWKRLKINVDLCKQLDVAIFSFPMKYIPLFGEDAKHREFTGKHWNRKFIRAIQSVLNVTKGIVTPARIHEKSSFFEEAFGASLDEFFEILYMPEVYIIHRNIFRNELGYTAIWKEEFSNLNDDELIIAKQIIELNEFDVEAISKIENPNVRHFLRHYLLKKSNLKGGDLEYQKLKRQFDKLIKVDQFVNLTLTYDFE